MYKYIFLIPFLGEIKTFRAYLFCYSFVANTVYIDDLLVGKLC